MIYIFFQIRKRVGNYRGCVTKQKEKDVNSSEGNFKEILKDHKNGIENRHNFHNKRN